MATLSARTPTGSGAIDLSPSSVAGLTGDKFLNTGREVLYFKNTNASSRTVTVQTPATVAGGIGIADISFAIAQNEEKLIGPFDPRIFNDGSGFVNFTVTVATGVTVAVIKVW